MRIKFIIHNTVHVEVKAVEVEAKEVYSYLLEVEALLLLETRSYSSFDVVQSSTLARRRLLRVVRCPLDM